MQKSQHNHTISSDIPVSELANFINPVKMSLFIPKRNISSVFKDWKDVNDYLVAVYYNIFESIPSYPKDEINTFINNYGGLTYTPHTNGYDFRFSPIDFINNLFKKLGMHTEIPFINLDNGEGKNYFEDYVRAKINDYKINKKNEDNPDYYLNNKIIDDVDKNLDDIVAMYFIPLYNLIDKHVIPKDMLLFLAYSSLEKFEKTGDDVYLILPYEYYVHILPMQNSPYPHRLYVGNNYIWYPDFHLKYDGLNIPTKTVDDKEYILNDHELLLAWDILKPGELERVIRDVNSVKKGHKEVDYDKYMELFEQKMNYYMHSPYIKYIKGKYGLNGYVGFSYPNEYLVFDKFHNSDTLIPSRKTVLTHGEAVYALPSDKFGVIKGTKQDIIQAKAIDERIKKINHTETFIPRLDKVIHGPNVSTTTFEEVIKQENNKMLIRKA